MREIRDKMSQEMKGMTPKQQIEFVEKKSGMQLYQDMFLGTRHFSYFLKYEVIILMANQLPASIGLFLRKILYPILFKNTGNNVVFGKNMTIRHPVKTATLRPD